MVRWAKNNGDDTIFWCKVPRNSAVDCLRELVISRYPGSLKNPGHRSIGVMHDSAPTGPNGSLFGEEFWGQFDIFRPYWFCVTHSANLGRNGAYFSLERAELVRFNFLGGIIRPFLKGEEDLMEKWCLQSHLTNPYRFLRGSLARGAKSLGRVFVVAGSSEPGLNGIWRDEREAREALSQLRRGGNLGRPRPVHLRENDPHRLNEVNGYIECYGLNLNLAVVSYPSSRGKFLNLDDMYQNMVHRLSSHPSKLIPSTPKHPSRRSTYPTSSQCPPRTQPQPVAASHQSSRSRLFPSTTQHNPPTTQAIQPSGGGILHKSRQRAPSSDPPPYPSASLPPQIEEENDTLLDTT